MSQKRTKLKDRVLPSYTKGEEIFNMVSHIVGGALAIAALVLCVIFAVIYSDAWGVVGAAIYGATMILFVHYVQHLSWTSSEYGKKSIPGSSTIVRFIS